MTILEGEIQVEVDAPEDVDELCSIIMDRTLSDEDKVSKFLKLYAGQQIYIPARLYKSVERARMRAEYAELISLGIPKGKVLDRLGRKYEYCEKWLRKIVV